MKILILQHETDTTPGTTLQWIEKNNFSYEILRTESSPHYPALNSFDALLICGGSMNVDQEEALPWLKKEKQFISSVISSGKKILGICLGGQLLAELLGAHVGPLGKWEAGWYDIQWNNQKIPVFHWHRYGFEIPPEGRWLAGSAHTKNQAFSYGDNILGFQFHPEVDATWIDATLEDLGPRHQGAVQTKEEILQLSKQNLEPVRNWYFSILDSHFLGK